ncbi:MAG: diaminopimelate epimerase [Candidatus Marinimicrobia bacterium]|nr:diaminopimelate epimerase [Candidatus Neomarinimicrobiota bacterium]|tara:strand:- start:2745 stop:3548 length:804 start_codon:yes stop_codon:yes gene_type:complete
MKLPIYNCNGNGNSFIIILYSDSQQKSFFKTSIIKKLCLNNKKITDGLVLVNIKSSDIFIDYYNNDGSWETLCLNGLRCVSLILNKRLDTKTINIICNNKVYKTKILKDDMILVELSKPVYKTKSIQVNNLIGHYIDVGAKHFVIPYDYDWPSFTKIKDIAQNIRYNKEFFPNGINVNFYKVINPNIIEVKTYEKGIENMMNSCASGSYACAFDYSLENSKFGEIKVKNDGGDFDISFDKNYTYNTLVGKAEIDSEDFIDIKLIGEK